MSPQTILFDLDDTLIHCNKYFDIVLERFGKIMMSWFSEYSVRETEIREMQLEIDLAGVHVHGLKAERFPQSLAETYEHFSKNAEDLFIPGKSSSCLSLETVSTCIPSSLIRTWNKRWISSLRAVMSCFCIREGIHPFR
ncbi:hypothetical protein [Paenibacillus larvae]|uniref:hypothetical protein n=1 Tax=Paenibacillus larvae TaxID=1464 RepID=UPI0028BE5314|nr:hypothetical protein [Paenibacillus larvae]